MDVLIGAEELARALGSDRPPVVADVRWSLGGPPGRPEFEAGHIHGSQWVDLEAELSAPPGAGGRHPLPAPGVLESALRRIGIGEGSAVVVCDAGNALAASRLWWLLTDATDLDVRVLDGGLTAWTAAGLPLETGPAPVPERGDVVASPGRRRQLDGAEVAGLLTAEQAPLLVDVRAAERYAGTTEPVDPVAGHIPGAVNLPSMAHVGPDGRFAPPAVLADRFAAAGVDGSAVVYCGSGITAAHTLLALEHAGISGTAIYPGSWSDWITDPTRPVATGPHDIGPHDIDPHDIDPHDIEEIA